MKYCTYCGQRLDDNASFCTSCGAAVEKTFEDLTGNTGFENGQNGSQNNTQNNSQNNNPNANIYQYADNSPSFLAAVLGFLCWWLGLILYFVWKDTKPGSARSALKGIVAAFCFAVPIIGIILYFVFKDSENEDLGKVGLKAGICGIIFFVLYVALVACVAIFIATGEEYALAGLMGLL